MERAGMRLTIPRGLFSNDSASFLRPPILKILPPPQASPKGLIVQHPGLRGAFLQSIASVLCLGENESAESRGMA